MEKQQEAPQTEQQQIKQEEPPIRWIYNPDANITLNVAEFNALVRALEPFEYATSVLSNARQNLIQNKQLLPVYKKDLVPHLDDKGVPIYLNQEGERVEPNIQGAKQQFNIREDFFNVSTKGDTKTTKS